MPFCTFCPRCHEPFYAEGERFELVEYPDNVQQIRLECPACGYSEGVVEFESENEELIVN